MLRHFSAQARGKVAVRSSEGIDTIVALTKSELLTYGVVVVVIGFYRREP
jgi:hypothetical protein